MHKVLVVDDSQSSREYLITLLERGGYDVRDAPDGEAALRKLREWRADLVITDMIMPQVNGYEFVRNVREDPELRDTPVVFYTAQFSEQDAWDLAHSCGVSEVLIKPCRPEAIRRAIERSLADRPVDVQGSRNVPLTLSEYPVGEIARLRDENQRLQEQVASLSRSEERLRAVIDHAPLMIVLKDLQGRYLVCNRAMAGFLGHPEKELVGKSTHDFLLHAEAETFDREAVEAIDSRVVTEKEHAVEHDGGVVIHHTTRFPIFDALGVPYGLGIIMRDVTEQRRTERRIAQDAAELDERARLLDALAKLSFLGLTKTGVHSLFENAASSRQCRSGRLLPGIGNFACRTVLRGCGVRSCRQARNGPRGDVSLVAGGICCLQECRRRGW